MCPFPLLLLLAIFFYLLNSCIADIGLKQNDSIIFQRSLFDRQISNSTNQSLITIPVRMEGKLYFDIFAAKDTLKLFDDYQEYEINITMISQTNEPFLLSIDLDSPNDLEITSTVRFELNGEDNNSVIPISVKPKRIGRSFLRLHFSKSSQANQTLDTVSTVGLPIVVVRYQGVVNLIFRIVVILMVTIFIFAMGCDLDPGILKFYLRRPIGPLIGFCCQFIIMPLVALGISKAIPIRNEFGFGLLTVGCSPGGGASNMWSLMLGGDINLSMLMTFISCFSSLFMMPLLMFIYARFFVDFNQVRIPYGNIITQLLLVTIPACLGLGLRAWKPHLAKNISKITRPLFFFFFLFFLTFGIYANLSIISMIATYPIVFPTSALLPWTGFCLAGLAAYLLRQKKAVIITIAIETGIQNVGVAILVLLYSMQQPFGDLGAVMPITVSLCTPIPLAFVLLGLTIKRRCCPDPVDASETGINASSNKLLNDSPTTKDSLVKKKFHDSSIPVDWPDDAGDRNATPV